MQARKIDNATDYLAYFQKELNQREVFQHFPKIYVYFQELSETFLAVFNKKYENLFVRWAKLLAIDAQLQILLELCNHGKDDLVTDLGLTEEEIIAMIRKEHRFFYREITGLKVTQKPKVGLIYMSEE